MSNVVDLLKKLINHERSARSIGNIAEAEAFATKIQKLLFDSKLSMSEVEMREEEINEPVGEETVNCRTEGHYNGWLSMACAEFSFCKIIGGFTKNSYLFIGSTSNKIACIAMFNYLSTLGEQLADNYIENWKQTPEYYIAKERSQGIARRYRNSWLQGYADALVKRLKVERSKLEAGPGAGNALIYIDKSKAAIQAFVAVAHPKLTTKYASITSNSTAHAAGYATGSSVGLSSRAALR